MSNQIRYALHALTNGVIHISEAERGLSCLCKCVECGGDLEAVQGNIRAHYFRHSSNKSCTGETAMHLFAKQVIVDSNYINIPGRSFTYINARLENFFETKKPDVTVSANDEDVHFEIRVSNPIEEDKKQFYCNGKHKCVEIDLSDSDLWMLSPEELKKLILEETYNKAIIYWEEETPVVVYKEKSEFNFWAIVAFIVTIALIIRAMVLFKRNTNGRVFRYY